MIAELTKLTDAPELSKTKPLMVIITGTDCGPCKSLLSTVEGLSDEEKGEVAIATFPAENDTNAVRAMGVRGVPTVLFYNHGSVSGVLVGEQSKDKLIDKIKSM